MFWMSTSKDLARLDVDGSTNLEEWSCFVPQKSRPLFEEHPNQQKKNRLINPRPRWTQWTERIVLDGS
jgi:hypothetical protein